MSSDRLNNIDYIIDPPTPFSPVAEWRRFMTSMENLGDQDHPQIREAIAEARLMISRLAKGQDMSKSAPGWDAKEISRIATQHYGGFTGMFEKHGWPERGSDMMRNVQTRVKEEYGSVAAFVDRHAGP